MEGVPPGVQPESGGRLQCLECGRWFRQLGQHVVAMHDMSADDYRRLHELPATRGLHAADIRERRAELARAAIAADRETYLRERLTPKNTTVEERAALARSAWRESRSRAGVQASSLENGQRVGRVWRETVAARIQERVEALGFSDVVDMLTAHQDLTGPALARLSGLTAKQVWQLRERHGFSSPGRWGPDHVPTSPAHRPRVPPEELAALAPGEQPERDGETLCRECGGWFRSLGQHLRSAHSLSAEQYQRRHGLDRHTNRAHDLGYADVGALLEATKHLNGADFAALLQVTPREAGILRQRHGYRTPRGRTNIDLTISQLDGIPLGEQPERDGKLLCRECGRWFRGLAQHLPHKHGMTPDEYRERHGLRVTHVLQGAELHEKRVAIGKARWEEDESQRAKLTPKMGRAAQLARARTARRATASRPGAQAALRATGDRLGRVLPERTRAEFEARARELSYDSVADLLAATRHLTGEALGELLGVASHRACALRERHGYPGGRSGPPPAADRLPATPAADTRLTCRECGGRYQFVGKHVAAAHGITPEEYRAHHGLSADTPLHGLTRSR